MNHGVKERHVLLTDVRDLMNHSPYGTINHFTRGRISLITLTVFKTTDSKISGTSKIEKVFDSDSDNLFKYSEIFIMNNEDVFYSFVLYYVID